MQIYWTKYNSLIRVSDRVSLRTSYTLHSYYYQSQINNLTRKRYCSLRTHRNSAKLRLFGFTVSSQCRLPISSSFNLFIIQTSNCIATESTSVWPIHFIWSDSKKLKYLTGPLKAQEVLRLIKYFDFKFHSN